MSSTFRPANSGSRISFASRTAFDALTVEGLESDESEEEVIVESKDEPTAMDDTHAHSSDKSTSAAQVEEPTELAKHTRTAVKKAVRAARQSAKSQQDNNPLEPNPSLNTESGSSSEKDVLASTEDKPTNEKSTKNFNIVSNGHADSYTVPALHLPSTEVPPEMRVSDSNGIVLDDHVVSEPSPSNSKHYDIDVPSVTEGYNTGLDKVSKVTPVASKAQPQQSSKKIQNVLTRTLWTFIMISGFLLCLTLGHAFMVLLVMGCATIVYREITRLFTLSISKADVEEAESSGLWSKTFNWYFFAVTNYFLYGESLIYYFKHVVFADAQLLPFATNHRFISFMLYTLGFVGFVASLQKQHLKFQFGLFCWVHMTLMVIVVSSHFIINNILEGLIWFWVPASLVICNDVFAYVWGITFGRTPLIALSPKKTVEGFVGAFFSTVLFGLIWGTIFMRYNYMICPADNLGVNAFSNIHCTPNPVFVWREWEIWMPLRVILSTSLGRPVTVLPYATYQFHLLVMSCFASLVAPFGGFFASGFKRAFDIKDFGDSIPGHGGMTDRMDCQFLMGVFTYVYYSSLIKEHHVTVGSVLQTIVSSLTVEEQLQLLLDLRRYLEGKGVPT